MTKPEAEETTAPNFPHQTEQFLASKIADVFAANFTNSNETSTPTKKKKEEDEEERERKREEGGEEEEGGATIIIYIHKGKEGNNSIYIYYAQIIIKRHA